MNPSKLKEAFNVLLGQLPPDVLVKPTVTEVESGKPNVRRFRLSAPATAKALAPLTKEDGLPRPGDPYPPDALAPPPEPDMIAGRVSIEDDSTETERVALIEVTYERAVPVPPPGPSKDTPQ